MTTTDQHFAPAHPEGRLAAATRWLAARPLHHRFAIAGSLVTLVGMVVIGNLVSSSIETGVVRNSAISSAVYMESFIAPMSQELAGVERLSAETVARMDALLQPPTLAGDLGENLATRRTSGLQQQRGPDRPDLPAKR